MWLGIPTKCRRTVAIVLLPSIGGWFVRWIHQQGSSQIIMSGTSEEIARDIETVEQAYLSGVIDPGADQQES